MNVCNCVKKVYCDDCAHYQNQDPAPWGRQFLSCRKYVTHDDLPTHRVTKLGDVTELNRDNNCQGFRTKMLSYAPVGRLVELDVPDSTGMRTEVYAALISLLILVGGVGLAVLVL